MRLFFFLILFSNICFGSELDKYVDKFITEFNNHTQIANQKLTSVNVKLAPLPDGIGGQCSNINGITINDESWALSTDTQRETLVFHELGHCVLKQDHRENSIMGEYGLDQSKYLTNREFYLNELFLWRQK